MSCRDERLELHHDGELSPAEALELEKHLTQCARCRAELEALRALRQSLEGFAVPPADPAWVDALARAVPEPPARPAEAPRVIGPVGWIARLWSARVSVPAPVLAAVVLVALLGWRRDTPPAPAVTEVREAASPTPAPRSGAREPVVDVALSMGHEVETQGLWPDLDQLSRDPTTRAYLEDDPGWAPAPRSRPDPAPRRPAAQVIEETEILYPAP